MLLVLSGKARSGKDTAANLLKDIIQTGNYTVLVIAYADFLKEILGRCFNLNNEQLYGSLKEEPISGLYRNTGSMLESKVCWTPRHLLQYIGTDVMRAIDPECWINAVKNFVSCYSNYDHIIISDGRFKNEIDWVLERGGIHIHVQRDSRDFVNGTNHSSETSLNNIEASDNTFLVTNNDTIVDFKNKLNYIWRSKNGR